MGQLTNTLAFYILGDNGVSTEVGLNGMFNELTQRCATVGDTEARQRNHRGVKQERRLPWEESVSLS